MTTGVIGAFNFDNTVSTNVILSPVIITISATTPTVNEGSSTYIILDTQYINVVVTQPTVYSFKDIVVDFTSNIQQGFSPLTVNFTALVDQIGVNYPISAYTWYFDFDNYPLVSETYTIPTVSHVFTGYAGQKYSIKCIVTLIT